MLQGIISKLENRKEIQNNDKGHTVIKPNVNLLLLL